MSTSILVPRSNQSSTGLNRRKVQGEAEQGNRVKGKVAEAPRQISAAVAFDQRLELAQMMGVAQGMVDLAERAIGNEAVVHNDAALEVRGDRGPRFSSAR